MKLKVKYPDILVSKLLKKVNYKWVIFSLILIISGALLTFYIEPQLVKIVVKFLFVAKPGHYVRKRHESKQRFKYKLYLWNVTNPDEITAGIEKPKLQEVGPYVFDEFKQKFDSTDNKTEDTVSFNFSSTYTFSPQLSAPLTGNEMVTILNTVLTSALVKIKLDSPHLLNLLIDAMDIIFEKPSSIFITMKAMDFIDNGIQIDCNHTEFAVKAVCADMRKRNVLKVMNDEKTLLRQRWFDNLNDSLQARYTIMRGSENIRDVGRVTAVNNEHILKLYEEDERCNVINGTDTMYFPPFQLKDEILLVFSSAACKSFPLRYKYMKRVSGVKTAYKFMDFTDPLLNPACECNKFSGCSASGLLDLYNCLDVFISISAPHFYLADSRIRNTIDGMHPKVNLHETGVYIDLQTGVALVAHQRVQVNFLLKRIPEYLIFSSIPDDIRFPLLWYEESFNIEKSDLLVIVLSKISQFLGIVTGYILMVVGIFGVTTTIILISHLHFCHVAVKPEEGKPTNQID